MYYRCARCQEIYPLDMMSSRGVKREPTLCKSCRNALSKLSNDKRRTNVRAYQSEWAKHHPRTNRVVESSEHTQAHVKVFRAIRKGLIIKQVCEVCGAPALAHHDNYSQPLTVRWLCCPHHYEHHHKEITNEKN